MKWLRNVLEIGDDMTDDIFGADDTGYFCVDVAPDGTAYTYWHEAGGRFVTEDELPDHGRKAVKR